LSTSCVRVSRRRANHSHHSDASVTAGQPTPGRPPQFIACVASCRSSILFRVSSLLRINSRASSASLNRANPRPVLSPQITRRSVHIFILSFFHFSHFPFQSHVYGDVAKLHELLLFLVNHQQCLVPSVHDVIVTVSAWKGQCQDGRTGRPTCFNPGGDGCQRLGCRRW
jgi:hypothetical protein